MLNPNGSNDRFKEIYLIRHDLCQRKNKDNDNILTKIHMMEAKLTGIYLANNNYITNNNTFDALYCSSIDKLTSEMINNVNITANIIAKEINYSIDEIINDRDLNEINMGLFTGLQLSDIKKDNKFDKYNQLYNKAKYVNKIDPIRAIDLFENVIIEAVDNLDRESDLDLEIRIIRFWKKIINSTYNKIIIISHHGILDVLNKYLMNLNYTFNYTFDNIINKTSCRTDLKNIDIIKRSNCSIQYIQYHNDKHIILISPNTIHLKYTIDWSNIYILNILRRGKYGISYNVKVDTLTRWDSKNNRLDKNDFVLKRRVITHREYDNNDTMYALNKELRFYEWIETLTINDVIFFAKLHTYRKYICNNIRELLLDNDENISGYCVDLLIEKKDGTIDIILQYYNNGINDITKNMIICMFIQTIYIIYLMHFNDFYHFDTKSDNICFVKTDKKYIKFDKIKPQNKIKSYGYQISLIDYGSVLSEKFLLTGEQIEFMFIAKKYNIDLWILIDYVILNNMQLYTQIKHNKNSIIPKELFEILKIIINEKQDGINICDKVFEKLQLISIENFADTKINLLKALINSDDYNIFKNAFVLQTIGYETLQMFQILYPNEYILILEIYFIKPKNSIKYVAPILDVDIIIMIKENYNNLEKLLIELINRFSE